MCGVKAEGLAVTPSPRGAQGLGSPTGEGLKVKQLLQPLLKNAKGGTCGEVEGGRGPQPQVHLHLCPELTLGLPREASLVWTLWLLKGGHNDALSVRIPQHRGAKGAPQQDKGR